MNNMGKNYIAMNQEKLACLVSPDGTPQLSAIGSDMAECLAFLKLLHNKGIMNSYHELRQKGFRILPVKVTVEVYGTEEDALNEAKNNYQ